MRIRFSSADRKPCALKARCTHSPCRLLTPWRREERVALDAVRAREADASFADQYRWPASIEGMLSQGVRDLHLRRARYIGLDWAGQGTPPAHADGGDPQPRPARRLAGRRSARHGPPIRLRSLYQPSCLTRRIRQQYRERVNITDGGVEQEADQQVDRHPGQVEECHRAGAGAGEKAPDLIEVAQRLPGLPDVAAQRSPHSQVEDPRREILVHRDRSGRARGRARPPARPGTRRAGARAHTARRASGCCGSGSRNRRPAA